jgi:hypothetical protein
MPVIGFISARSRKEIGDQCRLLAPSATRRSLGKMSAFKGKAKTYARAEFFSV